MLKYEYRLGKPVVSAYDEYIKKQQQEIEEAGHKALIEKLKRDSEKRKWYTRRS